MPVLTIAAPGLHPHPRMVMALRRALGGNLSDIASAVTQRRPVIEEPLPEFPTPDQAARIRQLLTLLAAAAVRPLIRLDGRQVDELALQEKLDGAELIARRTRSAANAVDGARG